MTLEIREEGRLLDVQVSGKLTRQDYERFVPRVETLIEEHGKLRILFEMQDFHGWELSALWEDVKFDLEHFRDIERLAMVGETRWQKGMAAFCKPFTTAKIRYFEPIAKPAAVAWLEEGL
jgi:hypothetical protein